MQWFLHRLKHLGFGLALFVLIGLFAGMVEAADDASNYMEISNEYIRIIVNTAEMNTGRFSVVTTGGDPDRQGDEDRHLIYGGIDPWTSYTTIRIGNENWVFGNPTNRRAGREGKYGEVVEDFRIVNGAIVGTWQMGPIAVTQKLSFVRSTTTGLMDTAKIEYQLHNTDHISHLVGIRIMLDTMLGANDGAPFRVNDRALLTDSVFYANEMPEFWQAFDSLSRPQVMAQGTLKGDQVTTPDRVYFTNWGSVADELWNFDFQPGRDFTRKGEFELDSALALFWDPKPLGPGETASVVAYYGLGGVTIAPGDLSIGVTSPAKVTADASLRQSFRIVGYIQNTGAGEARNVRVKIDLPKGLQLVDGQSTKSLGNLPVGETIQTSWQVIPTGDAAGSLTYRVSVTSINSEANQVERDIEIVSPAKLSVRLVGPKELSVENERLSPVPTEVKGIVQNIGGTTAYRIGLTLQTPIGLRLAEGERASKFVGSLEPGEETTVRWFLEPTGTAGNVPYSLKVDSSAGEQVANSFLLIPPITPKVSVVGPVSSKGNQVRPGEYFAVSIWATNIPQLQRGDLALSFNPNVVEVVGRSLDISKGTLFVSDGGEQHIKWQTPRVDNTKGEITGISGDRGTNNIADSAWGTLVTIHFRAKGPGDAQIKLDNLALYGPRGEITGYEVVEAPIVVHP